MNERKTSSRASGFNFARCWRKAEDVGIAASKPKKSSISTLVEAAPCVTRNEMSLSAGNFLFLVKSFPERRVKSKMWETTFWTADWNKD
ncbi:hypothetical protein [Enterocloster clostridioformis]|uniref:hypothetical protein n=1 Tax=Enterocloster clostridioformis TaxID=1531 RepID=UPI0006846F37|nr:hypothetical protein [Enterocloster clostridioformis]MDB2134630.1 hypothetical protein [Enterocloster clostridioformis]